MEVEAERLFTKAAESGFLLATVKLAGRHQHYRDHLRNTLEYIAKPFERSDLPAHQAFLGLCYALGRGVPQNSSKALELFQAAAEKNDVCGQIFLGDWYYEGTAAPQDYQKAVHWYQKAAQQGDAEACYKLGVCHQKGHGVAKSSQEAARLFRLAAEKEHVEAQYEFGMAVLQGDGVAKSGEGIQFLVKAALQGHKKAKLVPGILYQMSVLQQGQNP